EPGLPLRDLLDHGPQALRDGRPRPLGRRARGPVAAAEPYRGGQLLRQRLELLPRLGGATDVVAALGVGELRTELTDPLPIGRLRPVVEPGELPRRRRTILVEGAPARRRLPDEVEDVDLLAGVLEEVRKVVETLHLPHAADTAGVGERPVVAFAAERREQRKTVLESCGRRIALGSRRGRLL